MATTYNQVLNRLLEQMVTKDIKRIALAEMMDRNCSQVSRWLNNKVEMTIPTLLLMCDALDIDPATLFQEPSKKKKG